jgi:hypothetical protein
MNGMRVIFVALSKFSVGELHNALCVAQQLQRRGAEVLFLTPPEQQAYAEAAGMQVRVLPLKLHQQIQEVIEDFRPDAVVLADYYLLDIESEILDLEALLRLPVPCATFDSFRWAPEPRTVENRLIRPQDERLFKGKFDRLARVRALPEGVQILRACPVNVPTKPEGRVISLKMYEQPFTITEARRREVRQRLGVREDGEKLVMFAKASWALKAMYYRMLQSGGRAARLTYSYEDFLQELLIHYIAEVDAPVTVVGVMPQGKGEVYRQEQRRFVSMPFLPMNEFTELVLSCDLFVTDNMPSSATTRAVFGRVPVIVLTNTLLTGTQDGSPLTFPEHLRLSEEGAALIQKWNSLLHGGIYPFTIYPNGWIDELRPLFQNNPYCTTLVQAEMYALSETAHCFAELLCNRKAREVLQARQQAYIEQVVGLPPTYDLFETWIATMKGVYA